MSTLSSSVLDVKDVLTTSLLTSSFIWDCFCYSSNDVGLACLLLLWTIFLMGHVTFLFIDKCQLCNYYFFIWNYWTILSISFSISSTTCRSFLIFFSTSILPHLFLFPLPLFFFFLHLLWTHSLQVPSKQIHLSPSKSLLASPCLCLT